jgi:hypothetical protein
MDVIPIVSELFDGQVIPLFNANHCLTHGGDNFRT